MHRVNINPVLIRLLLLSLIAARIFLDRRKGRLMAWFHRRDSDKRGQKSYADHFHRSNVPSTLSSMFEMEAPIGFQLDSTSWWLRLSNYAEAAPSASPLVADKLKLNLPPYHIWCYCICADNQSYA